MIPNSRTAFTLSALPLVSTPNTAYLKNNECELVSFSEFPVPFLVSFSELIHHLLQFSTGAPAGGMNAATRTAVRYALCHGHTPVAIYNGFVGLLEGNVAELSWLRVDQWTTRGGSELGTNRTLPDSDMEGIAAKLAEYKIDSLLIIGGFEAMVAVNQLEKSRDRYKALKIPLVHLPATISNNVPITEWSIGSDTSINVLVEACDAIKQSASASRNRVFVVETQGAGCGYIAMLGALAVSSLFTLPPHTSYLLSILVPTDRSQSRLHS